MPIIHQTYYFASGEAEGARPAVILLHGAGGNHLFWSPEVRHLPGERIYALDLPSHGKSGGAGKQSIEEYAQAVLAFMDALKIHKAVLVGHSMGGAIALWLGIHRPSRVLGLGLFATAPRLYVSEDLLAHASSPATFPLAVKFVTDYAFSPQTPARLRALAEQRLSEVRPSVLYGDFVACRAFDETSLLGRVKAPTLILTGGKDKMVPSYTAEPMLNRIKNARRHHLEQAGHMLTLEEPQVVADLLKQFLGEIPYQAGAN